MFKFWCGNWCVCLVGVDGGVFLDGGVFMGIMYFYKLNCYVGVLLMNLGWYEVLFVVVEGKCKVIG